MLIVPFLYAAENKLNLAKVMLNLNFDGEEIVGITWELPLLAKSGLVFLAIHNTMQTSKCATFIYLSQCTL